MQANPPAFLINYIHRRYTLDVTTNIREQLQDSKDTSLDSAVWKQDSHELCDLAETIVNRHPRFAWMIVEAWLNKHEQVLTDNK